MARAKYLFVCLCVCTFYFGCAVQSQTEIEKPKTEVVKPEVFPSQSNTDAVKSRPKYGCRCHSKSAPTRAMHDAVKNHDCFMCHKRGEKLRRKGGIPKETHEAFLKQRLTDPRCIQCHGEGVTQAKKSDEAKNPMVLSGSTYCPKCKIRGEKDWTMCPKCGGPLIDLYKIMRHSALNPDHKICRQCHFMDDELQSTHIENVGGEFDTTLDCLECHEGHNECGRCH